MVKIFTVALKNGEYYYLPDFLPRSGFTELRLRAYAIGSSYYGGGFYMRNLNLKFQDVDLPLSDAVRISENRATCKVNGNIDCTIYTNATQYGGYYLAGLVGTGNGYSLTYNANGIVGTEAIDIILEFSEKIKIDYLSFENYPDYPVSGLTDFGLLFDKKELYRTPLAERGIYKNKMEAIITEENIPPKD